MYSAGTAIELLDRAKKRSVPLEQIFEAIDDVSDWLGLYFPEYSAVRKALAPLATQFKATAKQLDSTKSSSVKVQLEERIADLELDVKEELQALPKLDRTELSAFALHDTPIYMWLKNNPIDKAKLPGVFRALREAKVPVTGIMGALETYAADGTLPKTKAEAVLPALVPSVVPPMTMTPVPETPKPTTSIVERIHHVVLPSETKTVEAARIPVTYDFEIKRNDSGLISKIVAVPRLN